MVLENNHIISGLSDMLSFKYSTDQFAVKVKQVYKLSC